MNRGNVRLEPFVPRVASEWDDVAPGRLWRTVAGSLVLVDISGFTALSERLAQKGRIGAEELTSVLNRVFGQMLDVVYQRGGSLLKFGGDALLLLFSTEDHVLQACAATVEMRSTLRFAAQKPTSVGRIDLKMSSGIHTGSVDFYLVGDSHRELIITGPAASLTTEMEGTADASEIVVSEAVKDAVPRDFVAEAKGRGWLLRKRKINHPSVGPIERSTPDDQTLVELVPRALREHLGSGIADSEHRIASIAFVKFKGVDSMMEEEGPEPIGKHLQRLVATVQEAADQEAITFLASDVDSDGGKIILAAGVPSSRHDDEGRVLRAARQILDADLDLSVRIGVNRGHIFSGNVGTQFRQTYTVMGDTVNLAARLMAAAEPGMLYATPGVLNLSSTLFRTKPLEPFQVKGKKQPIQAFAVFEETGVRPPETTTELPFRGREPELEMLVGIVNTCSRVGRGGIMTISGDTGVGKSRLIAEVLDRCSGMDTLMVQAEPSGVDNPYWAFRDPLRRFLGISRGSQPEMSSQLSSAVASRTPDLAWAVPLLGDVMHIDVEDNDQTAEIDPRFRPERAADVLIELLSANYSRPVAIVAEDGQWLDEASTRLLERIGMAAQEHPWTVMVTARRNETGFEPMGEEIILRPLDEEITRGIAVEVTQATPLRPHELDAIVTKAGGNPLFLGEILRVVAETGNAEELPDSLDAVISREIDTLGPLPRQLLLYSSVLGRRFRREVLREFLAPEQAEFDDATVRELERFLEDEGEGRLAFRHNAVHDIAYGSLSYAKRRELHARAGDVIERQAEGDLESVAEYLSNHYSQSGQYEKTWRFARIAAGRAKRAYANTEAATHYERALEASRHVDSLSNVEVAELWGALGEVRELAGELEQARAALGKGLRFVGDDPVRCADIYLQKAGTWMNTGNYSQAKRNVTIGRRGLDPEMSVDHLRKLAQLDAFEASIHAAEGNPNAAGRLAKQAISRAEASGEQEALARAYNVLDFSNFMLGADEPRFGPRAIEIYNSLGFLERSVNVINNLGAYAYWEGEWGKAVHWYEEAVETARRSGNVIDEALARTNIAEVLVGQRHYEEASRLIAESKRVYEASHADQYSALVDLLDSRVKIGLGHIDDAVDSLGKLVETQSNGGGTPWTSEILAAYALALDLAGRPSDALSVLDDARLSDSGAAATVERLRGLARVSMREFQSGVESLRRAVEEARRASDLYEELLSIEALNQSIVRAGRTPDPDDVNRLNHLKRDLGVDPGPALA